MRSVIIGPKRTWIGLAWLAACLVLPQPAWSQCAQLSGSLSFCDEPLNDVVVLLKKGDDTVLYGSTTTDSSGNYTLSTPTVIPPQYRIVIQASSAAAEVRKDLFATPHEFNVLEVPTGGSCSERDFAIEVEGSLDCTEPQNSEDGRHGLAIWMAGEVVQGRTALEAALPALGSSLPAQVVIRYPSAATDPDPTDGEIHAPAENAFYFGPANEINIGQNRVSALFHEYGHYLQDQVASWISIPQYGGTCPAVHYYACEQACTVWPYFEALGHLVDGFVFDALVGSIHQTPSNPLHPFNTAPSPPSLAKLEFPDSVGGPTVCPSGLALGSPPCDDDVSTVPTLTEGAIAGALWDLVDGRRCYPSAGHLSCTSDSDCPASDFCLLQDYSTDTPRDEATLALESIFEVVQFSASTDFENPCNSLNSRPNPITTLQFIDTWRALHSGPQPQLWSAFARNHMDFDESVPPSPGVVTNSTHPVGNWTNSRSIAVEIDQQDNFSGIRSYYSEFDNSPTAVSGNFLTPSGLQQALAANPQSLDNASFTRTVFSTIVAWSGVYYLHTRAQDYQGNIETGMLDVGPLLVDVETPTLQLIKPVSGSTFVNTGSMTVRWRADDSGPAVSGIRKIVVHFKEPNLLYSATVVNRDYSGAGTAPVVSQGPVLVDDFIIWPIDPSVPITDHGEVSVYGVDVAGNEIFSETMNNIRIIAPSPERDTDADGTHDEADAFPNDPTEQKDTDEDGIGNNADPDDDGDGASDASEQMMGTDPLKPDTDGDGFTDGAEIDAGSNPLDADDTPAVPVPTLAPLAGAILIGLLIGAAKFRRLRSSGSRFGR